MQPLPRLGFLPIVAGDFTGEVRGEVFMTRTDFEASNASRVTNGGGVFKNPRNAVAGSLRKVGTQSRMTFAAYDILGVNEDSYSARLTAIEGLGLQTARSLINIDSTGDPASVIAAIESARPTLDFEIDGAVIKVDSEAKRTQIGVASHHPKWALAWKYTAEETRSVLRSIEVAIGRSGRVSFTGVIDPVSLSGVTVSKATLHNMDFITANRLGIGSDVLVSRANDVIPRVVGLDTVSNENVATWVAPTVCVQCGETFDQSEVNWRCLSPECSLSGWVAYYASRDCLDIEGLGSVVVDALIDTGLVTSPADLYDLTVNDLTELELAEGRVFGEKNAVKVHANIQASKTQPFNRVVTSLGVRKTGRTMGRRLATHFGNMETLTNATVEDLTAVEGIAVDKARHIKDGLQARADVIDRLAAAGVNMGSNASGASGVPNASGEGALTGMTVVITGAMSGALEGKSRNDMNELIENNGGKASGSVSAKTNLLVCGEPGSSKYVKAEALGVRIVTPEEFAVMVGLS